MALSVAPAFAGSSSLPVKRSVAASQKAPVSGGLSSATYGIERGIPGTLLERAPGSRDIAVSGSLSQSYTDWADTYRVFLYAGERFTLSMSAADGTDYGFTLFDPTAVDFDSVALEEVSPYYYGGPDSYPATIELTVPQTGYYNLAVWTWTDSGYDGGAGPYSMSMTCDREVAFVNLDPTPSVVSYGSSPTIYGRVLGFWDDPAAGRVTLDALGQHAVYGSLPVPLATYASPDGAFSFWFGPLVRKTTYIVRYDGTDTFCGSALTFTVNCYASVGNASARRTTTRTYAMSGKLGPQHKAGTAAVKVYLWRYVSGKWKAYGYRSATVANSGSVSAYSVKYKFPYTGKWRLQALHSDSDHASTKSGYTYLTVR